MSLDLSKCYIVGNHMSGLIYYHGLKLRVCSENLNFLFLNQNICCGYSKEQSVLLSTQNMIKLLGKKIFTILG